MSRSATPPPGQQSRSAAPWRAMGTLAGGNSPSAPHRAKRSTVRFLAGQAERRALPCRTSGAGGGSADRQCCPETAATGPLCPPVGEPRPDRPARPQRPAVARRWALPTASAAQTGHAAPAAPEPTASPPRKPAQTAQNSPERLNGSDDTLRPHIEPQRPAVRLPDRQSEAGAVLCGRLLLTVRGRRALRQPNRPEGFYFSPASLGSTRPEKIKSTGSRKTRHLAEFSYFRLWSRLRVGKK